MKKICIALDISPSAEKIATLGYEYAEALQAEVVLVHVVYDASYYIGDYDPIMQYDGILIKSQIKLVKDIKAEADKFLIATAKSLGEPDLETQVLVGDTYDAVLEFSETWGADLLVLGSHSHSAWENVLLGNIASKLVKHSKIPLLVIPIRNLNEDNFVKVK